MSSYWIAATAACAILAAFAAWLQIPHGQHHGPITRKPRAHSSPRRPVAGPGPRRPGPKGTAPAASAQPGAVPPHPIYGDLHHTPPGGITALIGEHGIRVGGRKPWYTSPGQHPYPPLPNTDPFGEAYPGRRHR